MKYINSFSKGTGTVVGERMTRLKEPDLVDGDRETVSSAHSRAAPL